MKKLLLILTVILVFSLGACKSAPNENYITEEDYNADLVLLQEQIDALEERLNNLVAIPGLNGVIDYYENEAPQTVEEAQQLITFLSVTLTELAEKKDKLDITKIPAYQIDANGEYVSFYDLGVALKLKYFNESTNSQDKYEVRSDAFLRFYFNSTMEDEELFARAVLLFQEIRNYTAYTISYNNIVIEIYKIENNVDVQTRIKIPLNIILNDAYIVDCETIYNKWFEIDYSGQYLDLVRTVNIYDQFVTDGTFTGYVLDYK